MDNFGEKGIADAKGELTQLHVMNTWVPEDPTILSRAEKVKSLSYLMFMNEKRGGKVKVRGCVNGAPRRAYIQKEDASSPTVANESVFITSVFYRKLLGELETYGFKINPYDPCMGNKMVTTETVVSVIYKKERIIRNKNGSKKMCKVKEEKKITEIWHVDDLMMSCKHNFELTKFLCYLANIYGQKLSMRLGKKHDYLGMDFEFMDNGSLEVSMFQYLDSIIDKFPELITGNAATLATDHLFSVRNTGEAKYLPEEKAIAFHHTTNKLLFLSSRERRDIQTAVSFLTTGVKKPDEDEWGNLKRVLKYLNGTTRLKLTLTIESLGVIKRFIDGSHNTHWDCKGHGVAVMLM